MVSDTMWQQLNNWIETYPSAYGYVHFNATLVENGNISISSIPMNRFLYEDILGNKVVEMVFMIHMIKPYDTEMSDVNQEAMEDGLNCMSWIEKQEELHNYPDFGLDIQVDKLELLANTPTVLVEQDTNLAHYQFQAKITYMEEV